MITSINNITEMHEAIAEAVSNNDIGTMDYIHQRTSEWIMTEDEGTAIEIMLVALIEMMENNKN
jgi:hypothetical protein